MRIASVRGICLVVCFILFFSLGCGASRCFAQNPAIKIIQTQQDFEALITEARQLLLVNFAIAVKLPVKGTLVSAQELDKLYSGVYRGAQTGFYHFAGDHHEIYMMTDMDRDECLATTCHEMVHAWQTEMCPRDQDVVVREGFARWVEYKMLDKIGAYYRARNLAETADPVYGVGFKKMQELEDKLGEMGVVLKVRQIKKLSD
jgi:hypothetical protein